MFERPGGLRGIGGRRADAALLWFSYSWRTLAKSTELPRDASYLGPL